MKLFENRDCMDGVKEYPNNCFDLAIVDPPYGIKDTWSKSRRDRFYVQGKLHQYQNTKIPPPRYFKELFRVSKNQIIWGGNYFTKHLSPTNAWIVWKKILNNDTINFGSDGELAWTSFPRALKIFDHEWSGARKGSENGKRTKIHPHQKPIAIYKWLLKNYAKEGDLILYTHVGSASSLIACIDMGFDYVGYELDQHYFEAANKRIEQHESQLTLFSSFSRSERL